MIIKPQKSQASQKLHDCPDCRCQRRTELAVFVDLMFQGDKRRSPDGICYGFEDSMDGFAVHAETCQDAGNSSVGPGSSCLKHERWRGPKPK